MDHSILNRNHPNHHYQQQVIKSKLVHHTIQCIKRLIVQYPSEFDINFLHNLDKPKIPIHEAIANLYNDILSLYRSNNIAFDDHWVIIKDYIYIVIIYFCFFISLIFNIALYKYVFFFPFLNLQHWNIAWRQALSFETLLELAQGDKSLLIQSFHPKCHRVLAAIFNHDLARYMRYYPWRWFSELVFIGAGGFSAVYAANIALLFDVPEAGRTFGTFKRGVAIKVVDEKILNEVIFTTKIMIIILNYQKKKKKLREKVKKKKCT